MSGADSTHAGHDTGGSTWGTIAQIGVPILAGVAAAASPAGARGLSGLTQTLGTMTALRDQQMQEESRRNLATKLSDLLNTQVTPGTPGVTPEQQFATAAERSPELSLTGQSPTEMGFKGTPATPGRKLSEVMGPAQAGIVSSLVSDPHTAHQAVPFIAGAFKPEEFSLKENETRYRAPYPGAKPEVLAQGPAKRDMKLVDAFNARLGKNVRTAVDMNKVPEGSTFEMPENPQDWTEQTLETPQGIVKFWVKRGESGRVPIGFAPEPGTVIQQPGESGPQNVLVGSQTGNTKKNLGPAYEKPERGIVTEEVGPDGQPRQVLRDPVTAEERGVLPAKPRLPAVAGPSDINSIRGQFEQQSKDFQQIRDAYVRIQDSAKNPTAAGDLSMIYNYMKMLDPGSVVRESEFALAASSGSYGERMQALVQKATSGERLADSVRQDFLTRAQMLMKGQLGIHEQREAEYKRIAASQNIDPSAAVPDVVGPDLRQQMKGGGGRPATRAEVEAARSAAGGDVQKAREALINQGIDPTKPVSQ